MSTPAAQRITDTLAFLQNTTIVTGANWTPAMRTLASTIVALLLPAALHAQLGGSSVGSAATPAPYGNGVQPLPTYAGTTGPSDVLLLSVNSVVSYDSNVLGTTQSHMGDEILGLGPRFAWLEQRGRVDISIDYHPYFQFYQHLTQYNRINQALAANVTFALASHWSFQIRDDFMDQTGTYQTESSQPIVPGLGPPTALNDNIYTPLAAERSNNSRIDLVHRRSSRTSVSFFGAYNQRTLTNQPSDVQSLLDTKELSSGMLYSYRLSSQTTFGMLYTFQNLQYPGTVPSGSPSRVIVHSGILSMAWKATPSLSLQVFGGPQYLPAQHVVADQSSGSAPSSSNGSGPWSWAAGGALNKASEKTALQLSAGRSVTDGGGLLTAATNTYATLGVNRRLFRRWSGGCNVTGSQSKTLNNGSAPGELKSLSGTVSLDHPLSEQLDARLSYTLTRQYSTGAVPFGSDLNHSIVSFTISYQLKKIPLGR
jgi:hypothetical protein